MEEICDCEGCEQPATKVSHPYSMPLCIDHVWEFESLAGECVEYLITTPEFQEYQKAHNRLRELEAR